MEKEEILEELELQIAECFHQQQRLDEKMEQEMEYIKVMMESKRSMKYKIGMIQSCVNKLSFYQDKQDKQQEVLDFAQYMYNKMKGDNND